MNNLNPEFTGTFSQRIKIRLRNREIETLLLEAEKWSALTGRQGWQEPLNEAWWEMAYIQFHDVFTGSHPTEVYMDLLQSFDQVEKAGIDILRQALTPGGSLSNVIQGHTSNNNAPISP